MNVATRCFLLTNEKLSDRYLKVTVCFFGGGTLGINFGNFMTAKQFLDDFLQSPFAQSAISRMNTGGHWAESVIDNFPKVDPDASLGENTATVAGAIAGDILGHGTRSKLWNLQPEDFMGTWAGKVLRDSLAKKPVGLLGQYATTAALGLGSGNYNPLNLTEGGRTAGYQAINPDDDPRESTTPVYDLVVERGLFGRRGRLLPWDTFKEERPDVSYQEYFDYQNYLKNKDDNLLGDVTLGLAKGTLNGINGPELSVMGYSVTPLGAAAALGIMGASKHLVDNIPALRITAPKA